MKLSYIHGFVAAIAPAFVSVMATAAPPDYAFQAELMYLDAGPGQAVAPHIADDLAFGGIAAAVIDALYSLERMSETVEHLGRSMCPSTLHSQEVGVSFDTRGSPLLLT